MKRSKSKSKRVAAERGADVPKDRVEVFQTVTGSDWYWHNTAKGKRVGTQGEGHRSRKHTSLQAVTHGSAVLPVYRRERDGTYTLLRKALMTRDEVDAFTDRSW